MKKTYFFPPNFDYPPNGFLWPGRILTDPFDPGTCLNRGDLPAYPDDTPLRESFKIDWNCGEELKRTGLVGLWLRFLQFVGIEASGSISWSLGNTDLYTIPKLETKFIEPSKEFIEDSVMKPEVVACLTETNFETPVYMVTGVKVAYGASMAWDRWSGIAVDAKLAGHGAAGGVPAGGGAETKIDDSKKRNAGFRKSSPIVFAYQVREICYDKHFSLHNKSVDKGAVLYDLEKAGNTANEKRMVLESFFTVAGMASEEETISRTQFHAAAAADESGAECDCMAP
ncbi:hypothetical protein BDV33DRAFT_202364 [Aspergillus novoparasiticus]|uniref:Uncharacterized protein n=1 Tax=Aspergillus novoparasiticus TaxID=986946 RepID=A0A5N6EW97_9EURO|nr:hypothetical protein BDV33DRAFT_202364 [Aspergillus novoparasiticus]